MMLLLQLSMLVQMLLLMLVMRSANCTVNVCLFSPFVLFSHYLSVTCIMSCSVVHANVGYPLLNFYNSLKVVDYQ